MTCAAALFAAALLCVPLAAAGAAAALRAPEWPRDRMEEFENQSQARFLVVYGTRDPRATEALRARALLLARRIFGGDTTRVKADADATEAMLAAGPVALLGNARQNAWTAKLAPALPVQFGDAGFRWQGTAYERDGDAIALTWVNPLAPRHFLLLFAANAPAGGVRHGMWWGEDDWRITREGELARSGRFAQDAARPWRYDAALDRDREAERARYVTGLQARSSGAIVVRAPAGLAVAEAARRSGEALLARMDAMGLPGPPRTKVTLTLYASLEKKGVLTRVTRPEHRGETRGEAYAALAAGRASLDLWSVAAARLDQLGAARESRFVESASAWLCGRLEGEPLEAAVSRVYFARALPTAEQAATRAHAGVRRSSGCPRGRCSRARCGTARPRPGGVRRCGRSFGAIRRARWIVFAPGRASGPRLSRRGTGRSPIRSRAPGARRRRRAVRGRGDRATAS